MVQTADQGQRGYVLDAFPATTVVRRLAPRNTLPGACSLQARTIVAHMAHLTSVQRKQSCSAAALHHLLLERLAATLIGPVRVRSAVPHILVAGHREYQAVSLAQYQPCQ